MPEAEPSPLFPVAAIPDSFQSFIRFTSEPAFALSAEGRIVAWNQPMERLTGFLPDFALGKKLAALFPAAALQQGAAQALTGEECQLSALPFSPLPEAPLQHVSLFPLRQPDGSINGAAGLLRPLQPTAAAVAPAAPAAAVELLSSVLRTSQVGILALEAVYDDQAQLTDFTFAFVNDTAGQMLGLVPELCTGQSLHEALRKGGSLASLERYRQALQTRQPVTFEKPFRSDDRQGWLSVTAAPTGNRLTVTFTDITGQKEAEQQHRESRQFLKTLTDATPLLMLVYDFRTLQPVFTNKGFADMLGLTREDMAAQAPEDFHRQVLHPDDVQPLQAHLALVAASADGEVLDFKFRMRRADGTYRWTLARDSVFQRATDGQPLLGLTVMQDIDELKQGKRLLEGVLNSSMNMIMGFEAVRDQAGSITDFRCTFTNTAVEELSGGMAGKLKGSLLSQLQQDPSGPARIARYREVVETGAPVRFEQANATGGNHYLVSASRLADGIVVTFADITDLKKAEEKLAHSEAFIRKITEAAPLIITLFDIGKGKFVFQSDQLAQVLGYTEAEAETIGKDPRQIVHPEDVERSAAHYAHLDSLPDGQALEIEFRARDKSGTYRWLVARDVVFSRNPDGSPATILGVTQDIHEVKRSKDLLASVLESSLSGVSAFVAVRNEAGEIIDFEWLLRNAAAERITGPLPPKGATLLQRYPSSRDDGNFTRLVQVVETGKPCYYESHYQRHGLDGWFEVTVVKMGDGAVITYSDITLRKQAEDKVRKNEALLTEAQQMAHLGVWEWDMVEDRISWSDTLFSMFGRERGAQPPDFDSYLHLLEPDDRERVKNMLEQTLVTHEPFIFPHQVKHLDGSTRHLIGKGRLLTDQHGRPMRLIGTTMDITELMQIREQLHAMEQVRLLGEAIPQIVWTALPNGRTNYVNQRWYDYTGLTEAQVLSGDWAKLVIHPDDAQRASGKWAEALDGSKSFELEVRMRRHDGAYRWFLTRAVPLLDAGQQVEKWFGTSTDIDDQKRTLVEMVRIQKKLSDYNKELSQKNEELRQINADLDNFIYTASHDLKAPINNIEGLLDLLQREVVPGSEVAGQVFEHMQQAVGRFKLTLHDLSNIIKADRTQPEDATLVQLPELLDELEADVEDLITETGAHLRFELRVQELVFPRKNIRSILFNLLSNALKYRSPERAPAIFIRTAAQPDGTVLLSMADNGLGLEPKHRDRIFEMFRRVHTHVEGSGVGLYIVKRIVDNAGGRIEVEGKPGEGTTFNVFLKQ